MRSATTLLAGLALMLSAESARADGPVLIELFTSQGCNSCPPADAYLGDLAKRKDVVALAFHVDYWDYIGWKDPFADALWTQRQRGYARSLGSAQIYTPQMVIDGGRHAVGSDRRQVERMIGEAGKRPRPAITLKREAGGLSLRIDGEGAGDVWIVGYDPRHETKVQRGENAGKMLAEFNIVRGLRQVDAWKGGALAKALPASDLPTGNAHAVLIQEANLGRVLAVATVAP